jgi:hypothetical protein
VDDPRTDPNDEGGYSGRLVLVLLMLFSVATVVIALAFIRPEPGAPRAPVEDRPFGPVTPQEQEDQPLIERGRMNEEARS